MAGVEGSSSVQPGAQPGQKRPASNPELTKARYQKWKAAKNTHKGKLDFYFCKEEDKIELFSKIKTIKSFMGDGKPTSVTTFEMLQRIMDFYIMGNCTNELPVTEGDKLPSNLMDYQLIDEERVAQEDLFICVVSSLQNLAHSIENHARVCSSKLDISPGKKLHFAKQMHGSCGNNHGFVWTSSPNIMGGKLLANLRMAHGYFTSGILPIQMKKFCEQAGIGTMGDTYLDNLQNNAETGYRHVVDLLAQETMSAAIVQEVGAEKSRDHDFCGIDILTDARHCWRKNARFSDVVCLGSQTHKVLRLETISKEDDICTQRHELIGVKRIYEYFDSQAINVKSHAHDNNSSVSKFVVTQRQPTENAKDTWHAAKGISRDAKKISSGAQYKEGQTWHAELSDKAASIKTHIYWCMKNCNGNEASLREMIDTIPQHYKGVHDKCSTKSRCRTDNPYIPSKIPLTAEKAEQLLTDFLRKTVVYKDAASYRFCQDTHYVESFNNALLQYHDKRICFGEHTYKLRIGLAILDWNENVDRSATSVRDVVSVVNPRRQQPVRVLAQKTTNFKQEIWDRWIQNYYKQ